MCVLNTEPPSRPCCFIYMQRGNVGLFQVSRAKQRYGSGSDRIGSDHFYVHFIFTFIFIFNVNFYVMFIHYFHRPCSCSLDTHNGRMDVQHCSMVMDMQHGHGHGLAAGHGHAHLHAASTWTCNRDMDMQQGQGHGH
jgi:hypothetical protein